MLGIIYALEEANLADHEFLKTHTEGWEGFLAYVMGQEDGCPKSPSWAADISGVPEATIRALAEDLGTHRTTLITGLGRAARPVRRAVPLDGLYARRVLRPDRTPGRRHSDGVPHRFSR